MKKIVYISTIVLLAVVASCSHKTTPVTATTTTTIATAPVGDIASGEATYKAKCGTCHKLEEPAEFTAARWVKLVDWMAPKAKLNGVEKANVLAYVQAGAKK